MTARERTAYPRFKQTLTESELAEFFTLTDAEQAFVKRTARNMLPRLRLSIYLKSFQKLGYLPQLGQVPRAVIDHIALQHHSRLTVRLSDAPIASRSRYRQAIHRFLQVKAYSEGGADAIATVIEQAAFTMSDPADLINVAIEELVRKRYELPAFSTIDTLANHIRHQVHLQIYQQVAGSLSDAQATSLDGLLQRAVETTRYPITRMKRLPAQATLNRVQDWEAHLSWLEGILNPLPFLNELAGTKIEQFATQAYQLEVSDLVDIASPAKRYTLLLCLLYRMQVRARDQLATMYLKRIGLMHNNGKKKLRKLRERYEALTDQIVNAFGDIIEEADMVSTLTSNAHEREQLDAQLGRQVRHILATGGGIPHFRNSYELLVALQNNNYLPLLQAYYQRHRGTFFRVTSRLQIASATQDTQLLTALTFIESVQQRRTTFLPAEIELDFASTRWQRLIRRKVDGEVRLHRLFLEMCVFSYIRDGLRNGDLYIVGSEQYADFRSQLLPWEVCSSQLDSYCEAVQLPNNAKAFVNLLREELLQQLAAVDAMQTSGSDLSFDKQGRPHLRQLEATSVPETAGSLAVALRERMPERHLLDILQHVHRWVPYTRHFTPPSGADPKLQAAVDRYLLTVFAHGTNMGPTQTARHLRSSITARVLGRLHKQHVTTAKLDAAIRDAIDEYARFDMTRQWGAGNVSVADGTHYELYENNLLGERHIRYGAYGGIAYHHISDTYIALFSHFIACGVWEAVYILDGLLKNKSVLQPDTVHADTQGQSEIVFGLAHLLGIQLMPRMRNWNKVTMYRADDEATYQHIDGWLTRKINWELLLEHWQELMQIVLSIQAGKVLPSWLLQKLRSDNPKSKLYLALRELGRVQRTLFLLRFVSSPQMRRQIQAATTKIEAYNLFSQWIFFAGDGIMRSRDPVEYEKRIKYKDLIANVIMLHNVVDMTDALHDMAREGFVITAEDVATLSPYLTEHIKRFGEYIIDSNSVPPPLNPDKPFLTKDVLASSRSP